MMRLQIAEMAGAVFALCRRGDARHILGHNVARFIAMYEQRTHIANQGGDPVAFSKGVSSAYRGRFLPQASVQAPNNLVLPEETDQEFVEGAVEPYVVVEFERFLVCPLLVRRVGLPEFSY